MAQSYGDYRVEGMACYKVKDPSADRILNLKEILEKRQRELHEALAKVNEALALISGDLDFAAKAQKVEDARFC